jgi:hypothetical protein
MTKNVSQNPQLREAGKLLWIAANERVAMRRICAYYREFRFIQASVNELQDAVSHEKTGHAYKEFV